MSDVTSVPRRSGGLVAVAILNIVFACIGMLGGYGMRAMNSDTTELGHQADDMDKVADQVAKDSIRKGQDPELSKAMVHSLATEIRETSPEAFRVMFAAGMTGGVLLLISGVGLLGQRRVLGRHGSMAAAVALLVCGGVAVAKLSIVFWSFPLIGAAYGLVLFSLVNAVFKRSLVR